MNKDSLAEFFRSKLFAGILAGVGITLIAVFLFEAGVTVGYHEATFSARWGQDYGQNFGTTDTSMTGVLPDTHLPGADGTLGKIVSISATTGSTSTMILASAEKPEEKVLIDSDTVIRQRENTMSVSGLVVGDSVVVLGTPNDDGEIDAKLVRIVPSATGLGTATTSNP